MNLVTYNLRSGGTGLVHWAKILDEFRPGLFFVQETVAPETTCRSKSTPM